MGLVEEVQNLCQSADDSTLRSKAYEWAGNSEPACKEVISTIKKIIKTRKALPIVRLRALKLHHQCMLTNNVNYLNFAVKKILSRLTILAQHRRSLGTMGRGEDIFGAISLKSEENKQASADFLVCLLGYIQAWAARFGRYGDGRNTPYLEAYMKLTSMGVTFPSPKQQPRPSQRHDSPSKFEVALFQPPPLLAVQSCMPLYFVTKDYRLDFETHFLAFEQHQAVSSLWPPGGAPEEH